ncbi:MAG: SURF1 family protein [Paracoccaceae bacterium]
MHRLIFAALVGIGGLLVLLWLGTWQIQRLAEKQELINKIEQTIVAEPVPISAASGPSSENIRYRAVAISGEFAEGHLRILASRKTLGPVYRIVRPFKVDAFGAILVDTGWLKEGRDVPPTPTGKTVLVGNLDDPNEIDQFTPDPDQAANVWFARDVAAMSDALETQKIMVVLRDAPDIEIGVTPWPVDTGNIPNDHLSYAITWFSLAAIWAGMTLAFVLRKPRIRTES